VTRVWVNQPIHSFFVGCLYPCLQGTDVLAGSPQPATRWAVVTYDGWLGVIIVTTSKVLHKFHMIILIAPNVKLLEHEYMLFKKSCDGC
jgi:hypothetical protein